MFLKIEKRLSINNDCSSNSSQLVCRPHSQKGVYKFGLKKILTVRISFN